jgi:hypothetical protein
VPDGCTGTVGGSRATSDSSVTRTVLQAWAGACGSRREFGKCPLCTRFRASETVLVAKRPRI